MDIRGLILRLVKEKGSVRVADITKLAGFSRAYVNRFFQELRRDGKIALVGKANKAHYIPATREKLQEAKKATREVNRILRNETLSEDEILSRIKEETGIFLALPKNVSRIIDYAFTEVLNNAIEHSRSERIFVKMNRTDEGLELRVVDRGIGIFRNIMATRGLQNELEAIQDLLKGKQTTDPERHSGEGIFFTSKVADRLIIKGSGKKLIYDNLLEDVFIENIRPIIGTEVEFWISEGSRKDLIKVFAAYAGEAYEFGKTMVTVDLYKTPGSYVSRSQARRILTGLEKFKVIVLDFKDVETVGQAFADEVFRVWKNHQPDIQVKVQNANENVQFMIRHVVGV